MVNSFSEITQPRNCNAVPQTVSYLSTALPARMTKIYKFFNTIPRGGVFKPYGPDNCSMDLTPRDLFGGLVQTNDSCSGLEYYLIPPSAAEICNGYREHFCREPKSGETFQFVLSNPLDADAYLVQSLDTTTAYSTANATLEVDQIPLVQVHKSAIFWFTFASCKPGEEKVDIFRPNVGAISPS